ncbi:cystathionine beta-lyase/cystathionine gamma-synthase [Rhizobium brockwellii]
MPASCVLALALELRLLKDGAVSLADTDSLIYHPASISRARQSIRKDAHLVEEVGEDLLRLSVGLEDVGDLIGDLRQALQVL